MIRRYYFFYFYYFEQLEKNFFSVRTNGKNTGDLLYHAKMWFFTHWPKTLSFAVVLFVCFCYVSSLQETKLKLACIVVACSWQVLLSVYRCGISICCVLMDCPLYVRQLLLCAAACVQAGAERIHSWADHLVVYRLSWQSAMYWPDWRETGHPWPTWWRMSSKTS